MRGGRGQVGDELELQVQKFIRLPKSGRLFEAACHHSAYIWKRFIGKLLQAAQFWFLVAGGGEQIWPFLVLEREYITLEKQKIFLSACLNSASRPGDGPKGWWAQRTWVISCNFDLFHMSLSEPAFWDWLPCLFYELILILILTWWLWKRSLSPVWTHVFVGCLQ